MEKLFEETPDVIPSKRGGGEEDKDNDVASVVISESFRSESVDWSFLWLEMPCWSTGSSSEVGVSSTGDESVFAFGKSSVFDVDSGIKDKDFDGLATCTSVLVDGMVSKAVVTHGMIGWEGLVTNDNSDCVPTDW